MRRTVKPPRRAACTDETLGCGMMWQLACPGSLVPQPHTTLVRENSADGLRCAGLSTRGYSLGELVELPLILQIMTLLCARMQGHNHKGTQSRGRHALAPEAGSLQMQATSSLFSMQASAGVAVLIAKMWEMSEYPAAVPRLAGQVIGEHFRFLMCAPLVSNGHRLGVLCAHYLALTTLPSTGFKGLSCICAGTAVFSELMLRAPSVEKLWFPL